MPNNIKKTIKTIIQLEKHDFDVIVGAAFVRGWLLGDHSPAHKQWIEGYKDAVSIDMYNKYVYTKTQSKGGEWKTNPEG